MRKIEEEYYHEYEATAEVIAQELSAVGISSEVTADWINPPFVSVKVPGRKNEYVIMVTRPQRGFGVVIILEWTLPGDTGLVSKTFRKVGPRPMAREIAKIAATKLR